MLNSYALVSKSHTYILGINAYDHDVSACLLRDGEIAYAIAKERITRGSTTPASTRKSSIIACKAEGIALDDVDLVVRNCYVLPIEDIEVRLLTDGRHAAQGAKSGGKKSALSVEVQQGRDGVAPSGACL